MDHGPLPISQAHITYSYARPAGGICEVTKRTVHSPARAPREARIVEDPSVLAQALESSSSLIGMADPAGRMTYANPSYLQALGYAKGEVIGQHFSVALSPKNPQAVIEKVATGCVQPGGWRGECLCSRKDGSEFPISLSVGPIQNRKGEMIGSFGVAQDISAQRQAEESLRRSEEQFRNLAEHIREIFFVLSAEPLRMLYISPAYEEVTGRMCREVYENPGAWIEAVHPEDRMRVAQMFAQSQQAKKTQMEYRIVRADGSLRWINARSFPVKDADGKFVQIVGIAEDITEQKRAEQTLKESEQRLQLMLSEAAQMTELLDVLQSCQTVDEAYRIVEGTLQAVLSCRAGALCIISPSRNVVEAVAIWGKNAGTEKTFGPDDCWALRRGKAHKAREPRSPLRCSHAIGAVESGHLCIPLMAHGETLGVLYLEYLPGTENPELAPATEDAEALDRQAVAVGERLSLALANLRLRDVLRSQSLRDPLTGLFNRRYLEETLEREVRRAARNESPVALLMLDIDRFKSFNDTFGHQAGDALLRAFGDLLMRGTRGQDVACRYGGEEFALVLAGASSESADKRAQLLREELTHLAVEHAGQVLGRVTVSVGVAVFPDHAAGAEDLVRAADEALYRAKNAGRDRVCIA